MTGPSIRAAADAAVRRGAPRLRTGTVTAASPLTVTMTGDTDPVTAVAVSGYVPAAADVVQVLLQGGAVPLLLGETTGRRVGCRLRRVANQSINSATVTSISWDTEDADPYGFITVTATTITVPAGLAGTYAITAHDVGNFGGRSFGGINLTSSLTGVTRNFRTVPDNVTSGIVIVGITIPLAAADSFTFDIFQTTGGAANHTAWINVMRVGP